MVRRGVEAHASVDWLAQGVLFFVRDYGQGDTEPRTLTPSGWAVHTPGLVAEAGFTLDMDAAQKLFEELWNQCFRSVNDRGNSDKLDAARKEHIDDLRKMAFAA